MGAEHPIDDLFKRMLDEHSVAPPPYVWSDIAAQVREKEKRRRRLWWLGWGAAALIVFSFGMGYWVASLQPEPKPIAAKKEQYNPSTMLKHKLERVEYEIPSVTNHKEDKGHTHVTSEKELGNSVPPTKQNKTAVVTAKQQASPTTILPHHKKNEKPVTADIPDIKSTSENRVKDLIPITSFERFKKQPIFKKNIVALSPVNALWSAAATWSVEGFFMPMAVLRNEGDNPGTYIPLFGSGEDANNAWGWGYATGVSFGRSLDKNWRIRSGIYYQAFSQSTARSQLQTVPLNKVSVDETNLTVYTASGPISGMSINPNLNTIEAEQPSINIEEQTGDSLQHIYQYLGSIEVPVSVGYRFTKAKWGVTGELGLALGVLVKNEVEADMHSRTIRVGETQGLQSFHLSGQLSITADYTFAKSWYTFLSPTIQYTITNWSNNPSFSFRPLQLGAKIGLGYRF